MSKAPRAKRPAPERSGPDRSASNAFRAPAKPAGPSAGVASVVEHAVDTAYRVIDDYMRQGAEAARGRRPQNSAVGGTMKNDAPSTAAAAAMRSWSNLAQMWFGPMASMWTGAPPYAARGTPPGAVPGAPPWMTAPWASAPWMAMPWMAMPWMAWMTMPWMTMAGAMQGPWTAFGMPPGAEHPGGPHGAGFGGGFPPGPPPGMGGFPTGPGLAVAVEVTNAEVTVDLWDPSAAVRHLKVDELHAVGGNAKLPRHAVVFRRLEGKLLVRAEIPSGQEPGTYAGPILDEAGAEVGRVHIAVH